VINHLTKTETPAMTDANATEVQIDTDLPETMTETGSHDRAAGALVGRRTHEHVARARNIQHTAVLIHLLPHGRKTVNRITHALIVVMVAGMAVEAQTI
jgi:hypothetical protein